MANYKTIHKKNLECLAREIYKYLHGLSLPIIKNIRELFSKKEVTSFTSEISIHFTLPAKNL